MELQLQIRTDLSRYLQCLGRLDSRLPESPDLEGLWPSVCEAYLPDGVREFAHYPIVSLGWVMFVGMALAKFWDTDWTTYSKHSGSELYILLRDAKGYDLLDDHVLDDVLGLNREEAEATSVIAGECASRVYHALLRSSLEPGTPEAAKAYIGALHELFLMGIYTELNALGYHLIAVGDNA